MRKVSLVILLSLAISSVCAYYFNKTSTPYFLSVSYKSNVDSIAQLFFNTGNGYSEKESIKNKVFINTQFQDLIFALPKEKIYGLRFDPMDSNGTIEIKSIKLFMQKNSIRELLQSFDLNTLNSLHQVNLSQKENSNLIARTDSNYSDPAIEIALAKSFDHWELFDFINENWLRKSILISLLITPICLALSYSENPRNINFKIFNKTRSIDWGESFSIEPEDCYRDTKTENIREIIEEIRFGKPWKNVIEKSLNKQTPGFTKLFQVLKELNSLMIS